MNERTLLQLNAYELCGIIEKTLNKMIWNLLGIDSLCVKELDFDTLRMGVVNGRLFVFSNREFWRYLCAYRALVLAIKGEPIYVMAVNKLCQRLHRIENASLPALFEPILSDSPALVGYDVDYGKLFLEGFSLDFFLSNSRL